MAPLAILGRESETDLIGEPAPVSSSMTLAGEMTVMTRARPCAPRSPQDGRRSGILRRDHQNWVRPTARHGRKAKAKKKEEPAPRVMGRTESPKTWRRVPEYAWSGAPTMSARPARLSRSKTQSQSSTRPPVAVAGLFSDRGSAGIGWARLLLADEGGRLLCRPCSHQAAVAAIRSTIPCRVPERAGRAPFHRSKRRSSRPASA